MIRRRVIIGLAVLVTLLSANAPASVQVVAQVDSSQDIYLGERFVFNIIIDGENQPGEVDLTPLEKYNPRNAGSRDVSQTSISIINGKTTSKQIKRYVMSYALTAMEAGRISLGPVSVTVGEKTYRTNAVAVNILKPGTTDQLDLQVTLSKEQCYLGEPVLLTVKFYFSAEVRDPQFNIPVLRDDAFYLENPDIRDPQTKEYDLGDGTTVLVSQHRVVHKNKQSNLLVLRKILIPRAAGDIQIEPAVVSADVAVARRRRGGTLFDDFFGSQYQYKKFMVTSEPIQLTVRDLPAENRPDGFYGLVGEYTISASAKPTTDVYMGDPITLTIKIGGGKYLKPIQWPRLENIPELANNFKMPQQKASPTIENGYKVFTQTIRPDNNSANVIPSIPVTYFDPQAGKYVVAKTEPIKLDLKPSRRLTAADIEGREFVPVNKEVEAIKKGISANFQGPEVLENMHFSPAGGLISLSYGPIWALPLVILIVSSAVKLSVHTTPERVAAKRRWGACGKAVAGLKRIASKEPAEQNEMVVTIMKQYVGERFDRMAGSLTPDDCYEAIITAAEDADIAEKYRQAIELYESARYGSMDVRVDSKRIDEIIRLIRDIEKNVKK